MCCGGGSLAPARPATRACAAGLFGNQLIQSPFPLLVLSVSLVRAAAVRGVVRAAPPHLVSQHSRLPGLGSTAASQTAPTVAPTRNTVGITRVRHSVAITSQHPSSLESQL